MTLYEINKSMYHSLPTLTHSEIITAITNLKNWFEKHDDNTFFMILNNDLRYYTVISWDEASSLTIADEIVQEMKFLGDLKTVNILEDGNVEFWVDNGTTCDMYLLFEYDKGVIRL